MVNSSNLEVILKEIDSSLLVVGLLFLLSVLYILFKFFFKATKEAWVERVKYFDFIKFFKKFKKDEPFKYTIQDLKKHKVFGKLKRLKDYEYNFYTHGEFDELKTKAFNIFLNAKIDSTIQHIMKIIDEATNDLSELSLRSFMIFVKSVLYRLRLLF